MDLSMSTTSISALGILTNSEPIRGFPVTKDKDKSAGSEEKKDEVKLIFLGTFFHDSNELNADLIQIKEPTQIKEIRVIPLGAPVNLSTGAYQLGATNPSELDLEFYYNDLQNPSKSAFTLLRNFSFNDKCRIHLTVDPEDSVITDGVIVRGIYSTITLAVYGYPAEVPVKEQVSEETATTSTSEAKKDQSDPSSDRQQSSPIDLMTASPMDIDSPKKIGVASSETTGISPPPKVPDVQTPKPAAAGQTTTTTPPAAPVPVLESKRGGLDIEKPMAIPTITTRVKFDSAFPIAVSREEKAYPEEPIDRERDPVIESDLSSDDEFEPKPEPVVKKAKPQVQPIPPAPAPVLAPAAATKLDDAEDISDEDIEDIFPDDDDLGKKEGKKVSPTTTGASAAAPGHDREKSISPEREASAIEPLSDQDDSLLDDFQEPGVEEIVSDEEMPDFPEYEYGEWEEQWAQIFGPSFNPFSESFQVSPLKNFIVRQTFGSVSKSGQEMNDLLTRKSKDWSKESFNYDKLETWVEDMEELIPIIPAICNVDSVVSGPVKESLFFWASIGVDLSLAKKQLSLPYKTRHIKVGIKLLHALSLCGEKMVEDLLSYKLQRGQEEGQEEESQSQEGKSFLEKLVDMFEAQFMGITMKLSILRTLDCMVLSKEGFAAFVGDEDDDSSCYTRLLEFSLSESIGTRVSFSIRSFLKKVTLLKDLSTFEEFVLGIVKNSSAELSTSVEAQDVDDCVLILESLRDMAKNVDQYLSHPLRILPVRSLVELPPTSVTGHDPKISFIKSLEQYHFVKLCTVLVNNKDLYGRTGGLVTEIISILLEWEVGLVYLCSEAESTTILLKTLAQLEDDGSSTALYACHCLEVIKCVDKLMSGSASPTEEEKNEDIACLQTLVSFLSTQLGRQALSSTLTIGDLIIPLVECLQPTEKSKFWGLSRIEKVVRRGYSGRLLGFIVRNGENTDFLMRHGAKLTEVISNLEEDAEGLTGNLADVVPYLRLTVDPMSFSLEGIEDLFGVIKSNQDTLLQVKGPRSNWGYPPELISALRLLCSQVVPSSSDDVKNCLTSDADETLIKELKYDVALVKLHSLDALSTFIAILQKITDDFNEQPATQSYTFVTGRGDALVNLLSPMVRMVRRVISQVVHVRKTEFKDTTAIPVLLKVYSVIESIPASAPCFKRSKEVGQNIIGSLLAYTIPALKQGVETEEELNKSTWTAVISEIIRYTMEEPATFLTGVSIFSELLPLPLPIASRIPLTEAECLENVKLRRLWSAYIHGLSGQIQEMIGVLCASTNGRLITLLKRLCVQLADLSGSTCMVVCRAILDAILLSFENDMEQQSPPSASGGPNTSAQNASLIKAWLDQSKPPKFLVCSGNTARLLGFLSTLVNNSGTIKSGIMQALRGVLKLDEKYTDLITQFCCVLTNTGAGGGTSSSSPHATSHIQAQENIVTVFQSLCDQEINMIVPMYGYSGKIYDSKFVLANSLPPKDLFITICNALITYVSTTPYRLSDSRVMEGVLRGLELISETEYGFHHMRTCFEKSNSISIFKNILGTLAGIDLSKPETFDAAWSCISSTVELLRSLTSPRHGTGSNMTNRGSVLTKQEFKNCVDWPGAYKVEEGEEEQVPPEVEDIKREKQDLENDNDDEEEEEESSQKTFVSSNPGHPLARLSKILNKFLARFNDTSSQPIQVTIEATEVENTTSMLSSVLEFLEEENESVEVLPETVLPPPDLLQELFSKRPVFVIVEKLGCENLPPFWLTSIPPAFDLDVDYTESDLVPLDLNDLCQSYLSDVDVIKEVERFYKSADGQVSAEKGDVTTADRAKVKAPGDTQILPGSMVLSQLASHRKPFSSHLRGNMRGGFGRGMGPGPGRGLDPFRSRPPNTSRPPSLHVDDFVALESSGQSGSVSAAYSKGGMRGGGGMDNFGNRGGNRGSPRGSLLGRPYSDRGRFRTPQGGGGGGGGNSYFGQRMEGGQQSGPMRRGSRGGAGKGYGNNDQRWSSSSDGRDNTSPYNRQDHSGGRRNMYEDKFRSSTPSRSQLPSSGGGGGGGGGVGPGGGGLRGQMYQSSRNSYREAPPMGRSSGGGNMGGNNNSAAQRWRDRRRPFNR